MDKRNLTLSQTIALEAVKEFVLEPSKPENSCICISGQPGTGKSYLIRSIVEACPGVSVTATTHKACSIIDGKSLCSFFRVLVKDSTLSNKSFYDFQGIIHPKYLTILIDEASMLDKQLWSNILANSTHCKFILIGDKNQLPSVRESANVFSLYPTLTLNEIVRQNDESLINVINTAKTAVEENRVLKIADLPKSPKVRIIQGDVLALKNVLGTFDNKDKVLTFTNRATVDWIRALRKLKGRSPDFTPLDTVVYKGKDFSKAKTDSLWRVHDVSEVYHQTDEDGKPMYDIQYITAEEVIEEHKLICSHVYWPKKTVFTVPVGNSWKRYLNDLVSKKKWREYFETLNSLDEFRHIDACTVHCAQGSTFNKVLIDWDDIMGVSSNRMGKAIKARLLYVALSRAKEEVIIWKK